MCLLFEGRHWQNELNEHDPGVGMIEYRILGPLEVTAAGRHIDVGGPKMRVLLAILLLGPNEVVSRPALIRELWGSRPPGDARHALDVYLCRLRKVLDAAAREPVMISRPGGYGLLVADDQLDVQVFERLFVEGRAALTDDLPGTAAGKLAAALECWRGRVLADLPDIADMADRPGLQASCLRLEELHLAAAHYRIEADLALGRHHELVGELRALVTCYPLHERLHALLMIALYRAGRQAEALAAYQAVRRRLLDELGIEPSPLLRDTQTAILRQEAGLDQLARALRRSRPKAPQSPLAGPKAAVATGPVSVLALSPIAWTDTFPVISPNTP